MATLNHDHEGRHFIYVKGAPERVLEMCERAQRGGETGDLDAEAWQRSGPTRSPSAASACSPRAQGRRGTDDELDETTPSRISTLLGLFGLIDPPRRGGDRGGRRLPERRHPRQDDHRRSRAHRQAIARELGLATRRGADRARARGSRRRRAAPARAERRRLRAREPRAQAAPGGGAAGEGARSPP
jgi:hypothetical protein